MRPTDEFLQHTGIVEVSRKACMVRTRVEWLHERGDIDDAEYAACERFRRDVDAARMRTQSCLASAGAPQGGSAAFLDGQVDALGRLREVSAELGRKVTSYIRTLVCEDASFVTIGKMLGVNHETAKSHCILFIRGLCQHYQLVDKRSEARRAR